MRNKYCGFFGGMARVLDIGNTWSRRKDTDTPAHKDLKALHADWDVVARDIDTAVVTLGIGAMRVKAARHSGTKRVHTPRTGRRSKARRVRHSHA